MVACNIKKCQTDPCGHPASDGIIDEAVRDIVAYNYTSKAGKISQMSSITLLGTGTCQVEPERRASWRPLPLPALPRPVSVAHGQVPRLRGGGVRPHGAQH